MLFGLSFLMVALTICDVPDQNTPFYQSLTFQQKYIYQNIKKERLKISLQAFVAGLIMGSIMYILNAEDKVNRVGLGCIFLATAFTTQCFWYTIAPKRDWMVRAPKRQTYAWKKVYRRHQHRYCTSLVVGMIGYFLVGYGL
jgi:hypothetical protein